MPSRSGSPPAWQVAFRGRGGPPQHKLQWHAAFGGHPPKGKKPKDPKKRKKRKKKKRRGAVRRQERAAAEARPAPDFTGTRMFQHARRPATLTLAVLLGRVVLIDFWTYTCINLLRTLPYLKPGCQVQVQGPSRSWRPFPEFRFENNAGNVPRSDPSERLLFPVVQPHPRDLERLGQPVLAGAYLIVTRAARSANVNFGEGDYDKSEAADPRAARERGATVPVGASPVAPAR